MARIMRDFKCETCGSEQERFIDTYFTEIQCECGGVAHRVVGMPVVKLEGLTGAFPGAYERWANIREANARQKAAKNR